MTVTEMIVPSLRSWSNRGRRSDANAGAADGTATWSAWGTTARVTVTDPAALSAACRLVSRQFTATERAAARVRPEAELHKLYRAAGRPTTVSPLLADLIAAALVAAERTGGDVDPTVAAAMTAVHAPRPRWSRDFSAFPTCSSAPSAGRPVPGWQQVRLDGRQVQLPVGVTLDLTATATAVACDRAAAQVRDQLGAGVLVELGPDAVSAGPAPDGGWTVWIADRGGNRQTAVNLPAGAALATSHFGAHARDQYEAAPGAVARGHLIDPRTGLAPAPIWRLATAIGFSGLEAASYTAAALIRGTSARAWLNQLSVPARLITIYDDVVPVGSWADHELNPLPAAAPVAGPRRTTP